MLTLSHPVYYSLELTPVCNNRCIGCGNVFHARCNSTSPLNFNDWQHILSQIAPHAYRVKLTGGEPSLSPHFFPVVELLSQYGITFSVFTNGRWAKPDQFLTRLCQFPECSSVLVSLHGSSAAVHDAFTQVSGSFTETVENIQRAVEVGLTVNTNTIVTSLNAHKLECIALFARSLGATVAVFNRYLGEADLPLQPTTSQLVTAVKMLNQLVEKKYPVKFGNCIPQCFLSNKSHGCLAGIALCTIDPWGNVRPCNHASTICGNLLQDSLETIWTGSAMQNWRAWLPETCRKCSALGECHGGCRAMATQGGDGSDPLLRAPLHTEEQPETHQFVLPKQACPHAVFEMKPEAFGYVLLRGNRIVPIAHEARPIIDSLDGNHSLEELERLHGNEAIQFIFSLWQTGLIEFT